MIGGSRRRWVWLSGVALVMTIASGLWLGLVADDRLAGATVLASTLAGLASSAVAFLLWARARRILAHLTSGRTGTVRLDGIIAFDDGQYPARMRVRGRAAPGPAVALEAQHRVPGLGFEPEAGRTRVVRGLRGEALLRWRHRLRRRSLLAAGSALIGVTPLVAAWVLGLLS